MSQPDPMTFRAFMSKLLRPTYVYRMASGKDDGTDRPMARGARTAMSRTQRQIDDLVLARAAVIADERRCAALYPIGTAAPKRQGDPEEVLHVRCEYARGHGTVGPGTDNPRLAHVRVTADWDHGAPSAQVWWKENT